MLRNCGRLLRFGHIERHASLAVRKPLHIASPADLSQHSQQARGGSFRCHTSKAKNMEKTAPKQHEDAELKKEEGEDVEDNHRKGPMADRVDNIGAAFTEDAERRMGNAVEKTRNTFARRKPKVPTQEEGKEEHRVLRHLGEEGKVAIRNVRQKLMQELGRLERDSKVSSDEQHMLASSVQELTDKHVAELDELIEQRSADSIKV